MKKLLRLIAVVFVAMSFITPNLYAGTMVPDTIVLKTDGYVNRKKSPPKFNLVRFDHKTHSDTYEISCGECHHDDSGQALEVLPGDDVKKCSECHNKFKKDKKNKKDIMVHENAIHNNCISCHKDFNKKNGDPKGRKGPAPTSCGKCHTKIKK